MEIKKENVLKEKEELKKSFYDLANSTEKSPDVLIKECRNSLIQNFYTKFYIKKLSYIKK
jgi:hypothetical protein